MGHRASSSDNQQFIMVLYEGVRRLAFLKLFGLKCNYEHYASMEFNSMNQIHCALDYDQVRDIFDNALRYEERAGYYLVAKPPMVCVVFFVWGQTPSKMLITMVFVCGTTQEVVYDPGTEQLNLMCAWSEQNTIREMGRNMRF